jgi:hypothetical protein
MGPSVNAQLLVGSKCKTADRKLRKSKMASNSNHESCLWKRSQTLRFISSVWVNSHDNNDELIENLRFRIISECVARRLKEN